MYKSDSNITIIMCNSHSFNKFLENFRWSYNITKFCQFFTTEIWIFPDIGFQKYYSKKEKLNYIKIFRSTYMSKCTQNRFPIFYCRRKNLSLVELLRIQFFTSYCITLQILLATIKKKTYSKYHWIPLICHK